MNTQLFACESRAAVSCSQAPARIVLIYEGGDAGRRAKRFAIEVLHGEGGDCEGSCSFWNFDALEYPSVRYAAAEAATEADFLVVAASGERDFSSGIHDWLETCAWMIRESGPAVVALLEDAGGECGEGIRATLRAIAERKDLEFVAFDFQNGSSTDATNW